MFRLAADVQVYLHRETIDFRIGINGPRSSRQLVLVRADEGAPAIRRRPLLPRHVFKPLCVLAGSRRRPVLAATHSHAVGAQHALS